MRTVSNVSSTRNHNPRGGQASLGLFGISSSKPKAPVTEIVTTLVDGEQYRALAQIAVKEGRSIRGLIRTATRQYLERRNAEDNRTPQVTPAMRAAVRAADERERFVPEDRQEWARPLSWGQVEATLAEEGN